MIAINVMGPVGLVNSIYSWWLWFQFLSGKGIYTDFMFAWFGAYFVNGILWTPLTVIWPIIPWGEEVMLRFAGLFAQMTLAGTFIAYWVNVGVLYYTIYMEPEKSGSTFATTGEATPYFGSYILISLVNAAVSAWFARYIINYARMIKGADDFKKAMREAAVNANTNNLFMV